jgi:hypothetical protein
MGKDSGGVTFIRSQQDGLTDFLADIQTPPLLMIQGDKRCHDRDFMTYLTALLKLTCSPSFRYQALVL